MKDKIVIASIFVFFVAGGIVYSLHNQGVLFASQNASPEEKKKDTGVTLVALKNDKAIPDAVAIKVGEYVQFNSKDGKSHEIASGTGDGYGNDHGHDQSGVDSGVFDADEAYKVQFKKTGTYEFHDNKNPKIFVTVVVYKPDTKED
ncbi:MAG: hypothetical protein H0W89_01745 [Candidatus Levybacteria bacterium]|nr:hypothetical protein [Candidatus Levybacteria bacterium]